MQVAFGVAVANVGRVQFPHRQNLETKHAFEIEGSFLKTGQHSIFVIIGKVKRIIYVCWIPYLLKIL